MLKTLLWSAVLLTLTSCSTSPTGRKQLKLYSSTQMQQMGVQSFDNIKKETSVSRQQVANEFVQCVATQITSHLPENVFQGKWEVVVFDDKQVNAFALPGGKIGVYTGLLEVTENQDQLAAVIGHEIGHVIADHGNERLSTSSLVGLGLQGADIALKAGNVEHAGTIMQAIGAGSQVLIQLPFSRIQESEADEIGLQLMAKSGFDPSQAVNLWHNMEKAGGGRQPELLSTHPSPQTRIQDLQSQMAQAQQLRAQSTNHPNCQKS
ncbi:M48 family metallopeptidase [Neptunicella marina]|uniref:M48 family metallopeptidase n=1 Tax=Neptunicella marina TaxID=2125989 RepID=A0A8J6J0V2_9ALTE|nr:M48 family metallopeptidase [Neptunicella marina]MBC3767673.1 M48 family metallopeptidase [Neptunicella marina]